MKHQKYIILTGSTLKSDNGSGRSVGQHLKRIFSETNYLVGYNGVCLDASTLNHCEPLSKVSKKWIKENCPEMLNFK